MSDQPQTPDPETTPEETVEDDGTALERSARSIREAQDAESEVESHGDIPVEADRRAEE